MTTVIVGGVAGGMSAATRLRRLRDDEEIVVLERGDHVSFANCGLPYHLSDVIPDRDALLLQTPRSLGRRFGLDVRVRHEVTAIDRAARTVRVHDRDADAAYDLAYDALVLSPGAEPVLPDVPGAWRMLPLRDVADLDAITDRLEALAGGARVVVVGAGYVGLEVTENLLRRGLAVTVVQRADHVLSGTLDVEMAGPVDDRLRDAGVDLRLNATVAEIGDGTVTLADGTVVDASLAIAATGIRPRTALAEAAGLALGPLGGIRVDARFRTSDPAIRAVGDAIEHPDAVLAAAGVDATRLVALAGLANRHGRAVADDLGGRGHDAVGALGTAIVEVCGLVVATVGHTEAALLARGIVPRAIHTHPFSHVAYYPGGRPMSVKLLVDPATDAILGAQIVGTAGVDTRIDVLATAIGAGTTASDLADLELAYAPQFGAAKDPVNLLGYVAGNQRAGQDPTIQWHELQRHRDEGWTLVDVRMPQQLAEGSIPGAIHIPVEAIREGAELPAGRLVVQCRVGQGSHTAHRMLVNRGHEVVNLDGGFLTWRDGVRATGSDAPVQAAPRDA